MTSDSTTREALLHQEIATLRTALAAQKEEIEALRQHNHTLRLKVDAMARKLFGQSSEKLDPAQLQLVFEAIQKELLPEEPKKPDASDSPACDSAVEVAAIVEVVAPVQRVRRTFDQRMAGLPVEKVIIDPAEVKAQPENWACMGEEVTRLIDYIPGRFQCQHLIRRKYVRKDARHLPPVIAPLGTLQDRCLATPRLLSHTLTQRFEMHLPYYRIEKQYERLGLPLSRQTMCGWAGMASDAATLVMEQIKREVFADGYVQTDETPVKYQAPEKQGVCGTGYLWVCHNPVRNVCLFVWSTGRGAACLEGIIPEGFSGTIQCDGYQAYESFVKSPVRAGRIKLAGCLAHARRKFFEAKAEGEDPQWVLAQLQQLYQIESRIREARAGPEEVLGIRQQQSAPIMERIRSRLEDLYIRRKHLPRSLTGEAITYARNQWEKLGVFLQDGRVQIDNNLVENAIRPTAIGKKNWLFIGDATTGERAATFYTLIGNAHRAGINAEAYLANLFERLPRETNQTVHLLTPHAWAEEQQAAKRHALVQTLAVQP